MKRLFKHRFVSALVLLAIVIMVPAVVLATVVNVGGGTWSYGRTVNSALTDLVYSHYKHNENCHSATAILGEKLQTKYAQPWYWAKAEVVNYLWHSSAVYWNNDTICP